MHWGALGELTFQTGFSPRNLEVKQQFRVVPQKVINRYPQLDNLGEDIRVLNLQIILNQVFTDIKQSLDYLVEVAQKGEKLPLTIGTHYLGEWVIGTYQISEVEITTDGEIVKATVSLVLNKVDTNEGSWGAI